MDSLVDTCRKYGDVKYSILDKNDEFRSGMHD